eukprot:Pgem_evm1s15016
MLTGDLTPTTGNALVSGLDLYNDIKKIQKHFGYCPQYNALIETMTAVEILTLYARLRGVKTKDIPKHVNSLII